MNHIRTLACIRSRKPWAARWLVPRRPLQYKETGTDEGLRVVGYLRCSTQEQVNEGLSIETQRSRIEAWCQATGATLVEIVEDAGVSGSKPLTERAHGGRIARLLETRNSGIDAVVVLRLDRLGRDAAEALSLLRRFRTGSMGLVSVMDRLDLTTPQRRAMAQMSAVFAELERSMIAQRTSEGIAELRRRGRVYGPVPFGWRVASGMLELDDAEQLVLGEIRALRGRGFGYARVAAALNEKGRPAKAGGRWWAATVRSVMNSRMAREAAA